MFWRDFFYFSKGERTGLIVLLSIIVIAIALLYLSNRPETSDKQTSINQNTPVAATPSSATSSGQANNAEAASSKGNTPPTAPSSKSRNTPNASSAEEAPSSVENLSPSATASAEKTHPATSTKNRESVSERVNRLTSYAQPTYTRTEKFAEGTVVELNTADTTTLKKVPGIGSAFAKRIVGFRALLGGYYSVTQLSEVYGMDEERYQSLASWFTADPSQIHRLAVNTIPQDSLQRHPYISYAQAKVIIRLRNQKGKLTGWENLQLLSEFTDQDKSRLQHYISFD